MDSCPFKVGDSVRLVDTGHIHGERANPYYKVGRVSKVIHISRDIRGYWHINTDAYDRWAPFAERFEKAVPTNEDRIKERIAQIKGD